MRVGLVIVSHSAALAAGVTELAAQMAPDVRIMPAGGTEDGGLGTDFDCVSAALERADSGAGVVLLYDLGSAQMTAELAVESLTTPIRAIVADAPLVEGAVAAAVCAQGGADLDAVGSAAAMAHAFVQGEAFDEMDLDRHVYGGGDGLLERTFVLRNELGMHARPAALTARAVAELDVEVSIRHGDQEVDARSVLALMGLGARGGDELLVRAVGRDAQKAVDALAELLESGFGEEERPGAGPRRLT
ncbi:dihydroxyacetone kinase phosphoryl donor subunit DhaM [Allokutzneria multivorans]|uniref:Phosphocarrier protein HPr n=1 Tax=Allokutzneria multivorans TaxID=1142134 RepID=A0ABP7TPA6_9PSEU